MNKWNYKVNNKLRGSYGEIDYKKRVISINKTLHKKDKEDIIDTITHEEMHRKHPKMHEKTVRKETPKVVSKMSNKSKARLYSKIK